MMHYGARIGTTLHLSASHAAYATMGDADDGGGCCRCWCSLVALLKTQAVLGPSKATSWSAFTPTDCFWDYRPAGPHHAPASH